MPSSKSIRGFQKPILDMTKKKFSNMLVTNNMRTSSARVSRVLEYTNNTGILSID